MIFAPKASRTAFTDGAAVVWKKTRSHLAGRPQTWADTTTAHGRLMLTVLGGLAEFERELIRTRTGEGRERAKARGVILGRKPKLTSNQRREAVARREAGEVLTDIARSYNVSHSTTIDLGLYEAEPYASAH